MPPVISMSSEEVDDDVAFKVLNRDNLPITVIGEAILKPFGRESQKQKPNGIVYPTRRIETNLENDKQKPFIKSNGYINNIEEKNFLNLKNNFSRSHGNLISATNRSRAYQEPQVNSKFTKSLNAKLKKLQKEAKKTQMEIKKPLFVTTVKKGQFLEPPPEMATLIGFKVDESKKEIKQLYAYASEPRVLNRTPSRNVHKTKCEAAAKAAASLMASVAGMNREIVDVNSNLRNGILDGLLPYQNIMFEKRICRGSNFAPTESGNMGDEESAAARATEARRRALARRRAKNQQVRAAQLRLSSPPPMKGRKNEPVQTDKYLEELFNNPPVTSACTQTEMLLERPISPFYVSPKTGMDQETQIYPGDLFNFDMEVQPILEELVGKTIEQALIEVLEEEEMAALKEQQRRFLEIRAVETVDVHRQIRLKEQAAELQFQQAKLPTNVAMEEYISDLLPSVLDGLENEGLISHIKEETDDGFMPWLMKEVTHELKDMVSNKDILTDIVREILENRAEIYKALNQTPRSEHSDEDGPTQENLISSDHLRLDV